MRWWIRSGRAVSRTMRRSGSRRSRRTLTSSMTGSSPHASRKHASRAGALPGSAGGWPRRRARRRCRPPRPDRLRPDRRAMSSSRSSVSLLLIAHGLRQVPRLDALDHAGIGERVVSPRLSSSLTLRSDRRMIFPDRVFGRSSVKRTDLRASRSVRSCSRRGRATRRRAHRRASKPPRRITKAAIACPLVASVRPTTSCFGDGRMADQRVLHLRGRDVVAGDEHHVVDDGPQPEPLVVPLGAVAGEVPAGEPAPVRVVVALRIAQIPAASTARAA